LVFLDSTGSHCSDTVQHIASGIYPDDLYWVDSSAYINYNFDSLPPSYGVATLDGLNNFGLPYNEITTSGPADVLTSKPIFLNGALEDSVYLSYYFQAGGYGDMPDENDSLILEFKTADTVWNEIWSTVNTSENILPFKLLMIGVNDEYLYDGFQFRFRNRATLSGNNDHWNIDYVLVDEGRSFDDTLFRDVAITTPFKNILKDYEQMPWNQFKNYQVQELDDEHGITIRNNYNQIVNTSYQYTAFEKYSGQEVVPPTTPVSINFDPYSTLFISYPTFEIPASTPGYEEDSIVITLKHILNPASDINRRNDTLYYDQPFYNYYAYDDGTAEKAYGLEGLGANLAIHFYANEPDTLSEVYIHWTRILDNNSDLLFSLVIWDFIWLEVSLFLLTGLPA
jgi:hypothetical protein